MWGFEVASEALTATVVLNPRFKLEVATEKETGGDTPVLHDGEHPEQMGVQVDIPRYSGSPPFMDAEEACRDQGGDDDGALQR